MKEGFYERYWERSTEEHLSDFGLKWPKLSPFIPKESGIVILDFGCGAGQVIGECMKLNPRGRYIGADVSEAALQSAQKKYPQAEFRQITDGGKFPLADRSVDFIFTSEVIEHVYDTENAIRELFRVLKPGGKLLLTTPYHGFIKNLVILLSGNFDTHFNPTGPHVRFWSNKTLFGALKKAGFSICSHGYYGRFYPLSHSIYLIAQKS